MTKKLQPLEMCYRVDSCEFDVSIARAQCWELKAERRRFASKELESQKERLGLLFSGMAFNRWFSVERAGQLNKSFAQLVDGLQPSLAEGCEVLCKGPTLLGKCTSQVVETIQIS